MFTYPVRRWFWLSLITALMILALEFIVGWIGIVIFAFSLFPLLGIIAAIIYPILVVFIMGFWLVFSDFANISGVNVVWLRESEPYAFLLSKAAALARKMNVDFEKLGVVWTQTVNAFTYGVFRPKIVLYKGLLDNFSEEEIDFVIAHELGHIKHRWVWFLYCMANAVVILPLFMPLIVRIFFYFFLIPTRLALLWFSRECEYIADREAVLATGNMAAALTALIKLGKVKGVDIDLRNLSERDIVEKVVGDAIASLST
ncbi:MAG: hypothetical protein DRJ38_09395, partial [Thermoprotei archaeon]